MISTLRLFAYRTQGGPNLSPRQRRRLVSKARREIHQPVRGTTNEARRNYEFAEDLAGEMDIPFDQAVSSMLDWTRSRVMQSLEDPQAKARLIEALR